MPKRVAKRLTEAGIDKIPKAKREKGKGPKRDQHPDNLSPGLVLRVSELGVKTWAVIYRFGGAQGRITLGDWPGLGVENAREEARRVRQWVADGFDPKTELKAEAGARRAEAAARDRHGKMFADLAERYIKRECARLANGHRYEAAIRNKLIAAWGDVPVSELRRRHLTDLTDELLDAGTPAAANRVHEIALRIFTWALDRGDVELSPFAGKKPPAEKSRRDRVLDEREIQLMWPIWGGLGYPFGPWAQLLLLLGQRRSELASLQWCEIDLDKATWIIPASKSKSRRAHLVPLPDMAMAILKGLPEFLGGDHVFTTTGGRRPVSGFSKAKARTDERIREMLAKTEGPDDFDRWVWHDLRRTCSTGIAALHVPEVVRGLVLGHKPQGLGAIYNQHRYENEKRDALERWARRVTEITTPPPANVVQLDQKAR